MQKIFMLYLCFISFCFSDDIKFERDDIFKFCYEQNLPNKDKCLKVLNLFAKKYAKECDSNIAQSCFGLGEIVNLGYDNYSVRYDENFNISLVMDDIIDFESPEDIEKRVKYFKKSCELNYYQSCLLLGLEYSILASVAKEERVKSQYNEKSKYFFSRACDLEGDSLSCSRK